MGSTLTPAVGQLIHIPTVTSDYNTEHYQVTSCTPSETTTGSKRTVKADEILVDFKHNLIFKAPLPESAKTMHLDTTLVIFSSAEEGKIVRLQDRPREELGDNSIINVSHREPTGNHLTGCRRSRRHRAY